MSKNLICEKRKKIYLLSIIGLLFFSLLFLGCGGSSSNEGSGGNETAHSGPYSVDGYIQKGPFISGSTIIIQELDDSFNPTGVTYQTTTNDDFGSFIIGSSIQSNFVEIIATGYYFNEINGELSDSTITLRAISDLSIENNVNVNLLTTLEKDRIIHLITNENKSFVEARSQAEIEILSIFNISGISIYPFCQIDLTNENEGAAILLAISALLQNNNSVAELSEMLSKINLDIKNDGVLDNPTYKAEIVESAMDIKQYEISSNLKERYSSLGLSIDIPNIQEYMVNLSPVDTESDLVAHYLLNGNFLDNSGNENAATGTGILPNVDRFGMENGAYQFNGGDHRIEINDAVNLWLSSWTYSIWFKLDSLPSEGQDAFLLSYNDIIHDFDGYNVQLYVDDDNILKSFPHVKISSDFRVEKDVWYHAAISYGDSIISIYVNGELRKRSYGEFWDSYYPNTPLAISGRCAERPSQGEIYGSVDDVRLYNRELNQYEIMEIYNQEKN